MKGIRRWLGTLGVLVVLFAAPLATATPAVAGGPAFQWFSGLWGKVSEWVLGGWMMDGRVLGPSGRQDGEVNPTGPTFEPSWNKDGPALDPNGRPLNGVTQYGPDLDPTS